MCVCVCVNVAVEVCFAMWMNAFACCLMNSSWFCYFFYFILWKMHIFHYFFGARSFFFLSLFFLHYCICKQNHNQLPFGTMNGDYILYRELITNETVFMVILRLANCSAHQPIVEQKFRTTKKKNDMQKNAPPYFLYYTYPYAYIISLYRITLIAMD